MHVVHLKFAGENKWNNGKKPVTYFFTAEWDCRGQALILPEVYFSFTKNMYRELQKQWKYFHVPLSEDYLLTFKLDARWI